MVVRDENDILRARSVVSPILALCGRLAAAC